LLSSVLRVLILTFDGICIVDYEVEERSRMRTAAWEARAKGLAARDRTDCPGWRYYAKFPYLVPYFSRKIKEGRHGRLNDVDAECNENRWRTGLKLASVELVVGVARFVSFALLLVGTAAHLTLSALAVPTLVKIAGVMRKREEVGIEAKNVRPGQEMFFESV
jgi:hypothetical protein